MAASRLLGLFPGQGSQKVGMGKDLYGSSALARDLFARADQVLGFDLSAICMQGPNERLMSTAVTQPAILTVSVICYRMAEEAYGGELPLAGAAGHSLGEYSALVAAGAIRFEDAVKLVNRRGTYMQEAVPAGQGKMIAILGREAEEIEAAIKQVQGIVELANINSPGQIVAAGEAAAVDSLKTVLGGKVVELPVSAPFHCSLMKPAEEKLAVDLEKLEISRARFPIYANFSAAPVRDPEEIRAALRKQVCAKVRWVECMENAIRDLSPDLAVEFGAGNVLGGMLKRIRAEVAREAVSGAECPARLKGLIV